jgi:hypothetical protein
MTKQQMKIISAAIDDALAAIPNGDDRQLTDWVMANRYRSFPKDVREAMAVEGVKDMIRDAARRLGVELRE